MVGKANVTGSVTKKLEPARKPVSSAKFGVTCADLRSLKACTGTGQYGSGWNPGWGDWSSNADAHGVTATRGGSP